MALDTKATDWRCCLVRQVGGAAGLAGGAFLFDWHSQSAGVTARFALVAGGVGVGGHWGGVLADDGDLTCWGAVACAEPFSAADLDRAAAAVYAVGVGLGLSLTLAVIDAKRPGGPFLFRRQNVSGFGVGVGLSVVALAGTWAFNRLVAHKPLPQVWWA